MTNIKKFRIVKWKKKPVLQAKNISKSFDERPVLQNINFSVYPGEIFGVLGPNGAGKSVTFQILIGTLKASGGEVWVSGKNISDIPIHERAKKFRMGYIPQNESIWRGISCMDNLMAAAQINIRDKKLQESTVEQLLTEFSLNDVRNVKASNLSGGQRRKVVIARALINNPRIIIMDEPYSQIDPRNIEIIKDIIFRLRQKGIAIIISDHSVSNVLSCADSCIIISDGEILSSGTPEACVRDKKARSIYFGENF